jgi:hypothetical protein
MVTCVLACTFIPVNLHGLKKTNITRLQYMCGVRRQTVKENALFLGIL